ncbi:FAD-dependent monooxygenase [Comamonas flocculans]|uniref:Ubiquinone biosynthesis protein UbiH n=1 Tax=Comamonas flocculans TaxID=2597701 RepID=A0A5B8RTE8_9BURK|nr:FAD-dependent monooxygenase [Comamonas flocculans]QEA12383.1 ubiquinone biosynthesis protein UbiH [Comamonas flocculans]
MAQSFDICIRGAGIVGRTLALLLAQSGLRVALVAAPARQGADVRAYALNAASRGTLQALRAWPQPEHATAVAQMQVWADGEGSVAFDAARQGVEALAWIVDVPALEQRLQDAIGFQSQVQMLDAPVAAPLTVVCEGRASAARAQLGVEFAATPYGQDAIATRLRCELPHAAVARQWFGADGSILAFLPLAGSQGNSVAVVWSVAHASSSHWLACDEAQFLAALQAASRQALGRLELAAPRACWPLVQARALRWSGTVSGTREQAWVLAGDAAHAVHPLAGQGLNLGLADAVALAHTLRTRETWRGLADLRPLRAYERERKAQVQLAMLAMDGLQQLFARDGALPGRLRNHGMTAFDHCAPLKRWASRHAMGVA